MWDKGNDWVQRVTEMHRETVARWHEMPVDNPYDGLLGIACQQHQFNFLLWHEEDVARSPNVSDQRIAEVKRQIDKYNQQRNDWIEKIDVAILEALAEEGVTPTETVPLNTETPGSATDRLSIMSLRIFHMDEQLQRDDADEAHKQGVQVKLARARGGARAGAAGLVEGLQGGFHCLDLPSRAAHHFGRNFRMHIPGINAQAETLNLTSLPLVQRRAKLQPKSRASYAGLT